MSKGLAYDPTSYKNTVKAKGSVAATFTQQKNWDHSLGRNNIHPSLDPKHRNLAGKFVRECRRTDLHPHARGIIIALDGSGSMQNTPTKIAAKLPGQLGSIVASGWLKQPQILFAQVCDYDDVIPLQLGQFEGDNTIDSALTSMVMPGGGRGSQMYHEAYGLVLFAAMHAELDSLKDGEKGFLFIVGDERPNQTLTAAQVLDVFGIESEKDWTFDEMLAIVRQKFHVHWITPDGTDNFRSEYVISELRRLFGENHHLLGDGSGSGCDSICEFITGIIALQEGHDLDEVKSSIITGAEDPLTAKVASNALTVYAANHAPIVGKGVTTEALVTTASGATRL